MVQLPRDFKELLVLLNENHVEYVIVGGYAMAFHGVPRYTGDMDVLIHPTVENAQNVISALKQFGFGSLHFAVEDFISPEQVIQLGYPPLRIDILSSIDGVKWDAVFSEREVVEIDEIPVPFIGRKQLMENKKASGRIKDLADLDSLS